MYKKYLAKIILTNQEVFYVLSSVPKVENFLERKFALATLWALYQTGKFENHEIKKLQIIRLSKLFKRAQRVRFWADRFVKAGINNGIDNLNQIECLPILKKSELKAAMINNLESIIDAGSLKERLVHSSTSGSMGQPIEVYQDRKYLAITSAANRILAYDRFGIKIEKNKKVVGLNVQPVTHGALYFVEQINPKPNEFESCKECIYFLIEKNQPAVIRSRPSALFSLARLIKRDGKKLQLKAVVVSDEHMDKEEKSYLEKHLGCPVFSLYGAREFQSIASECPEGGYHLFPEYHYAEIVDDNDSAVLPGQWGRIVITNFNNLVMPFIRYDTGDIGRFLERRCTCGVKSQRIEFKGRGLWYFILPSGKQVEYALIKAHLQRYPDIFNKIRQYQFIQETPERIFFYIVPEIGWKKDDRKAFEQYLFEAFDREVNPQITIVDHLDFGGLPKPIPFVNKINSRGITSNN